MSVSTVEYELQQGFIHHWLVAGPQEIPLKLEGSFLDQGIKQSTAKRFHTSKQEITITPVERGTVDEGTFTLGEYKGEWNYYRCKEDHLIDLSASFHTFGFVRSWAYTQLYWSEESTVKFSLSSYGPVDVWINKKHIYQSENFAENLEKLEFDAQLDKGTNRLLIRFANIAAPDALLAIKVKITSTISTGKVQIPTVIPSISRRNQLEAMYDQMYVERYIHAHNQDVTLQFPETQGEHAAVDVRLQTTSGRIYGQSEDRGKPGSNVIIGSPSMLPVTTYQVLVMPRAWEFYESQIRISRRFNVWSVGRQRFSTNPYGYPEDRKREALVFATTVEGTIFAEIAKIALGKWADLEVKFIKEILMGIQTQRAGSEVNLLGFLGMQARYGAADEMPAWLSEQIREVALLYHYADIEWESFPSKKAAHSDREIIYAACKIMAGQLYPDAAFSDSGKVGTEIREEGEKTALAWMEKRGLAGFTCWDSKVIYTHILASLSHLIDLASNEVVWELASVLMDKMLFSIALNSYHGVYGSSQGQGSTTDILSGLLEPTSGITRIFWGMGIFNLNLVGTVSVACMKEYEFPPIIAEIAASASEEILNKEQQAAGEFPINKVTYRTPHYMLSSAQSYRPGQAGDREHIWQATLGPQAVVFVNHPRFANLTDVHTPNYWLGNATLPRAAQYKNTLIAIYDSPAGAGMDFTHAYLPVIDFDEYRLEGKTVFARKGDGYIALTALNGLDFITLGATAYREFRSPGRQNTWICQMSSSLEDETFENFQEKIRRQKFETDKQIVKILAENGDTFEFGWDTPLRYNGEVQAISNFPHYDNPYTSSPLLSKEIVITNNDFRLGLNFGQDLDQ